MSIIDKIKQTFGLGEKMIAIGTKTATDINQNNFLITDKIAKPTPKGQDILVEIKAVSVNPVDTKLRQIVKDNGHMKVFGYDAVGIVESVGSQVSKFNKGDRVYYAGNQKRLGADSQFQLVDQRLVALAPKKLDDAHAAGLPLTSITAYEILVDHFGLKLEKNAANDKTIFIINGAGGAGTILIQLSKYLGMRVFATASSEESVKMVEKMGADVIVDRKGDIAQQIARNGAELVDYVAILHNTDNYFDISAKILKPFGKIASIVENEEPLNIGVLKNKGQQFYWEYMFAKSNFDYRQETQGEVLRVIAKLMDAEVLQTTVTKVIKNINADNLMAAHKLIEDGHVVGKIALDGPFTENGSEIIQELNEKIEDNDDGKNR